jgi:hypothetical protein
MAIPVALDPAREDQPINLPPGLLFRDRSSPLRPSMNLLHRHLADPVTVSEEPSQARRRGASLRAWAVLRYSGPYPLGEQP